MRNPARKLGPQRKPSTAITPIEYGGLQRAYDHFNKVLFASELPDVFITYQRKANSMGYFSADRFAGRVDELGKQHELALNPDNFVNQTDLQICQTLCHEMTHAWQQACGEPPSHNYHDKEWSTKMVAIGLQPSSTGAPGGKATGSRMSDYPIKGGLFLKAYADLAATGWKLNLESAHRLPKKPGTESKTKFACPKCPQVCWGKPSLELTCTLCGTHMKLAKPAKVERLRRAA